MKNWSILPPPPEEFINQHLELPSVVTTLLWNRNLKTPEQIDAFLNPDYKDLHNPYLFKDMVKAVDIIFTAIEKQERIVIHGDYDADGVCASVIIISCLKKLGAKNVDVFLPHRETDGYGLNPRTIEYLKSKDTNLIITCDCGISNTSEITLAKSLDIKVIVTDHHAMPAIFPPADAIIHPLVPNEPYPDKGLAGGGVAFKLVQALLKKHQETHTTLADGQTHEAFEKWLLDLVSISTVGDMVPLTGESRTLVKFGLMVLTKTHNLGLQQLLKICNLLDENHKPKKGSFDTQTIGFHIAPRINAAGRMDHANVAFKLLMAETPEESEELAEQLQQNNVDRQKLTEQLVNEARAQIKNTEQENNPILFVVGDGWPTGILGLIASRLKDEFNRPILAMGKTNGQITGSGRSIKICNIIKILQSIPHFFSKFGGHPQACGFSLKDADDLEKFKKIMLEQVASTTQPDDFIPELKIDSVVDLDDVNWKLYESLQKFAPFGMANEEPLYAAYGLTIVQIEPIGKDAKHLKLLVKHNSHLIKKTIGFHLGNIDRHPEDWKQCLKPGDTVDMAFTVGLNEWNGNKELQLTIEDIKKAL